MWREASVQMRRPNKLIQNPTCRLHDDDDDDDDDEDEDGDEENYDDCKLSNKSFLGHFDTRQTLDFLLQKICRLVWVKAINW